jgi:hypothetical protein
MIHEFADDYKIWYNQYQVEGLVACPRVDTDISPILDLCDPKNKDVCFKISYTGASPAYNGQLVTDGMRYAYIVNNQMVPWMNEPRLNLYVRSRIRQVVREFLDSIEMWPL